MDELLGGRVSRRFSAVLEEIAPSLAAAAQRSLRVLHESASDAGGKSPVEAWMKRLGADAAEFERVMRLLHVHELASFHATFVETTPGPVWRDFLNASYRLQVAAEPRALVVADTLVETLKRAPRTMARHYRREAALNLRELMRASTSSAFPRACSTTTASRACTAASRATRSPSGLEAETDSVQLPQIVHAASCASFHPPMLQFCDEERCAVAHGFEARRVRGGRTRSSGSRPRSSRSSKRAARSRSCGSTGWNRSRWRAASSRVRLWLVSREGFSAEAAELLSEREAFGSCREQLELLTSRLRAARRESARDGAADEFAIELPMGEDTELIAAHTVEQIARRMEFQPEDINKIKHALIEACINASEHSLSTERKIYNRFRVEGDKLVITVSSRGSLGPYSRARERFRSRQERLETPKA